MSNLVCISIVLPAQLTDKCLAEFEMVFSELLDSVSVSYYRLEAGDFTIEALFYTQPDMRTVNALLTPLFNKWVVVPISVKVERLPDRDWIAENRASFPPRLIGRFWICGSHIKRRPPVACLPLLVDAGLAFGSGTHPTTEGCLKALQMIRANLPLRVLDMGSGSAILAMAVRRLWPASVVLAVDNDPLAIDVATRNRKLNKIAPSSMQISQSEGFFSRYVRQSGPYNLIIANILARPLIKMAPGLQQHLATDGWLVLSGILNNQVAAVRNAYRAQILRCWHQIRIEDWTTLVMRPSRSGCTPYLWRGRCPTN